MSTWERSDRVRLLQETSSKDVSIVPLSTRSPLPTCSCLPCDNGQEQLGGVHASLQGRSHPHRWNSSPLRGCCDQQHAVRDRAQVRSRNQSDHLPKIQEELRRRVGRSRLPGELRMSLLSWAFECALVCTIVLAVVLYLAIRVLEHE